MVNWIPVVKQATSRLGIWQAANPSGHHLFEQLVSSVYNHIKTSQAHSYLHCKLFRTCPLLLLYCVSEHVSVPTLAGPDIYNSDGYFRHYSSWYNHHVVARTTNRKLPLTHGPLANVLKVISCANSIMGSKLSVYAYFDATSMWFLPHATVESQTRQWSLNDCRQPNALRRQLPIENVLLKYIGV